MSWVGARFARSAARSRGAHIIVMTIMEIRWRRRRRPSRGLPSLRLPAKGTHFAGRLLHATVSLVRVRSQIGAEQFWSQHVAVKRRESIHPSKAKAKANAKRTIKERNYLARLLLFALSSAGSSSSSSNKWPTITSDKQTQVCRQITGHHSRCFFSSVLLSFARHWPSVESFSERKILTEKKVGQK